MKSIIFALFMVFINWPAQAQHTSKKSYRKRSTVQKRKLRQRKPRVRRQRRKPVIAPKKTRPQDQPKPVKKPEAKQKRCGKRCIEFQMMKRLWLNDIIRKDRALQRRPRIKRAR